MAVLWAAFFNFMAAFVVGTAVAKTIGKGLIDPHVVDPNVILAALLGAIVWDLITWYLGLPTSSSHALLGGFGGAAIAKAGFGALILRGLGPADRSSSSSRRCWAWLLALGADGRALLAASAPAPGAPGQGVPATAAASRRPLLAEPRRQRRPEDDGHHRGAAGVDPGPLRRPDRLAASPLRAHCRSHPALGRDGGLHARSRCGTALGGWRIVKTMGTRITKLRPFGGFCAETAGGITVLIASRLGVPVSTTHTITGAIVGVGAAQRLSAVRWGVATRIVWAWILTMPMSAVIAALSYLILSKRIGL